MEFAMGTKDLQSNDQNSSSEKEKSFWNQYGPYIILGLMILYVIILGIGTYAELTDNEKILNWLTFM